MPSKKTPKVPIIDLDVLLKKPPPKQARQRSTSSSASAQPVIDGITTTSGMELPFSLDNPSHDPIFQTCQQEETSKHAADNATAVSTSGQASSFSGNTELNKSVSSVQRNTSSGTRPPAEKHSSDMDTTESETSSSEPKNLAEKAPASSRREEHNSSDMEMSDSSSSSTVSTDSSVDVPISEIWPMARKKKSKPQKTQGSRKKVVTTKPKAKKSVQTVARSKLQPKATATQSTVTAVSGKNKKAVVAAGKDKKRKAAAEVAKAPAVQSTAAAAGQNKKKAAAVDSESTKKSKPRERAPTWPRFGQETLRHNESSAPVEKSTGRADRSLEESSRKRARTEAVATNDDKADKSSRTSSSNNNNEENTPPTPPMGETPRPRLNEEEKRLFDKIDRMILDDEWAELKKKIDNQILEAEEEELLSRIDQSIRAAEEAEKPGGRVTYCARVLEDGSLEEEYPSLTEDPLLVDEEPSNRKNLVSDEIQDVSEGRKRRILDLDDVSAEVSHKARLPKFTANGKDRLLTREAMRKVVDSIMTTEQGFVLPGKIAVSLDDCLGDPYSVQLHSQGHPRLVEQVETHVSSLIRAEQSRVEDERAEEQRLLEAQRVEELREKERQDQALKRKEAHAAKQQKNYSAYQKFLESYKDTRDIEFKGSGIHRSRANKEMWDCHKKKYGSSCGDDCACSRDLPYLTGTVVNSYVASEIKKDPNWKNNLSSPVGFASNFSEKFFPLLEKEFPNEAPKELLARLVLMWPKHQQSARFGMKCSKNCPCLEGWDVVFKRGRLRENEIAAAAKTAAKKTPSKQVSGRIPRRKSKELGSDTITGSMLSGAVASQAAASATSVKATEHVKARETDRIPRRSPVPRDLSSSPSQFISAVGPQNMTANPTSIPRHRKSTEDVTAIVPESGATIARKGTGTASQNTFYEIIYQPGEAMGMYCVNDKKNGNPVCRIVSLSESATRKHPQLHVGAIVTDVTHAGGHVQPVRTYSDLKMHHKKSAKNGTAITVRFTNPVKSSLIENLARPDSHGTHGEWTASGDWIPGPSSQGGWAGGARVINAKESQQTQQAASQASFGPQTFRQDNGVPLPHPIRTATSTQAPPRKPSPTTVPLQYSTTMTDLSQRQLPPPTSVLRPKTDWSKAKPSVSDMKPGDSLLKTIAGPGRKRKVKFDCDRNETRFYERGTMSYRMAAEVPAKVGTTASQDDKAQDVVVKKAADTKDLINAIENKDFREVIAVLQAGASPIARDDAGSPKDRVKKHLQELKFELQHDPNNRKLQASLKDFELKRKVLAIYIDAQATIDRARFNKLWHRYAVQVDRIKDVCLSVRGNDHAGSKVLQCRTRIKGEEMKPLPPIPMEGTILHDWRNDKGPEYSFNYNPQMTDPSRSNIVLSLYKGEECDAIPPILLGETVIPLSRVSTACVEKERIEERLPPNEYIANCVISVHPSKPEVDETRQAKAKETAAKLKDIVTWISQFNEETKREGSDGPSLSGQITLPKGGISLLHAAIYLDEPDLVSQLMKLGADPEAPSDVGSARLLATNLLGDRMNDEKSREVIAILLGNGKREECAGISSNAPTLPEEEMDAGSSSPNAEGADAEQDRATSLVTASTASSSLLGTENKAIEAPPYMALAEQSGNQVSVASADRITVEVSQTKESYQEGMSSYTSLGEAGHDYHSPKAKHVSRVSSKEHKTKVTVPAFSYPHSFGIERCRFYGKPGRSGCHRGSKCPYMHFSPLVGRQLDDVHVDEAFALDPSRVIMKTAQNEAGQAFHTAIYHDPRDDVYYGAEGLHPAGTSNGISWYLTTSEARQALRRVVAFHQRQGRSVHLSPPQQRRDIPTDHGIYGPQSSAPKRPRDSYDSGSAPGYAKRARRGGGDGLSPKAATRRLFNRAVKQPNLSTVYNQIFFQPLKKSDWIIEKDKGQFTATIVSPYDGRRFVSSQKGNSAWKTEKLARASAFVSLLEHCISHGEVNAQCTMNKVGHKLSF